MPPIPLLLSLRMRQQPALETAGAVADLKLDRRVSDACLKMRALRR
jgi:hypothetical protein